MAEAKITLKLDVEQSVEALIDLINEYIELCKNESKPPVDYPRYHKLRTGLQVLLTPNQFERLEQEARERWWEVYSSGLNDGRNNSNG